MRSGVGVLADRHPWPTFACLVPFRLPARPTVQGPSRWLQLQPLTDEQNIVVGWDDRQFSAMYGGYFGAGNGILMLARMGLSACRIHLANSIAFRYLHSICGFELSLCTWYVGTIVVDGRRRAGGRMRGASMAVPR